MTENRHKVVSAVELASRLGENPRTVQRKAKSGEYPAQKLPGTKGAYVFTAATAARLVEERKG